MSAYGYLEVKNWEHFQHYKDRRPPWIKLHAEVQDNYEFHGLPDASKAHLVGIWILASKLGNKVPADPAWISARIGATEPVDLDVLIDAGFVQRLRRASDLLQTPAQVAMPETETETETETEKTALPAVAVGENRTDHTIRSCIGLVVEKLYFGNRPPEAAMRNEASIAKQLGEFYGFDRLARAIEGLARRRDAGQLSGVGPRQAVGLRWLNSKKFDVNQLAASEDEFFRSPPEPRRGRGKVTDIGDIVATITPRTA